MTIINHGRGITSLGTAFIKSPTDILSLVPKISEVVMRPESRADLFMIIVPTLKMGLQLQLSEFNISTRIVRDGHVMSNRGREGFVVLLAFAESDALAEALIHMGMGMVTEHDPMVKGNYDFIIERLRKE